MTGLDKLQNLCIIILNWNDFPSTRKCLISIAHQTLTPKLVVVVDNGSNMACLRKLSDFIDRLKLPNITLVVTPKNLGYGGGFNFAFDKLHKLIEDFEFIWFLNNDTLLDKNAIANFEAKLLNDELANRNIIGTLAMSKVSGKVTCYGGVLYNSWLGYDSPLYKDISLERLNSVDHKKLKYDYIHGASFIIRTSFFKQINGFSRAYFLYFEELHLMSFCKPSQTTICPDIIVYHDERTSVKRRLKLRDICSYHAAKSCFRYTARTYPTKLPFVIFTRLAYKLLRSLVTGRSKEFTSVLKAACDFKTK